MKRTALLGLGLYVVLSGCGINVQNNYQRIRPKLLTHDYDGAVAYVDAGKQSFYAKDNRLLYYLDKGMVLHLAGRYADSNKVLEDAKNAAEELWTESIGAHAAAWVSTDNSLPYQGEDFERVLIHFIAALNHLGLQAYDDARVEARQITNELELCNAKYEGTPHVYRDDAFSRWLSGRLAEMGNDGEAFGDAWIDYRKAIDIYEKDYAERYATPLPEIVVASALRTLGNLGKDFAPEQRALQQRYPNVAALPQSAGAGRIVFLHLNGEAPFKVDRFWTASAGTSVVRIAYPEFVPKPHAIEYAVVGVRQTGAQGRTHKMEDVTAIAIQNLHDHMGRIKGKAIARALSKFAASQAAQIAGARDNGDLGVGLVLLGKAFNAASAIMEEADKRSWVTLPATVTAGEFEAPPGPVTLDVQFMDAYGRVVEYAEIDTAVQLGQTSFVSYRTYR